MYPLAENLYRNIDAYYHQSIESHKTEPLNDDEKNQVRHIFDNIGAIPDEELNFLARQISANPRITNIVRLALAGTDNTYHSALVDKVTLSLIDELSCTFLKPSGFSPQIDNWLKKNKTHFTKETIDNMPKESVVRLTALLAQLPPKKRRKHIEIFNHLNQDHLKFFSSTQSAETLIGSSIPNVHPEDHFLFVAEHLSSKKTKISDIHINDQEWDKLIPHLRYGDFTEIQDENRIFELLEKGANLSHITIKNDKIKNLPPLPTCQYLSCGGCTALSALPAALPACRTLYCYGCRALSALPAAMPACQYLYCSGCTGLSAVPAALPACQELYCSRCRGLSALPAALPACQELNCSGCTGLSALPAALPACQELNCSRCTGLGALPAALPACQALYCEDCPNLNGAMPELPASCQVFTGQATPIAYSRFTVDVDTLANAPKNVLVKLGNTFLLKNKPFPNIDYVQNGEPSPGVDVGGVKRDFLSRMMESLFTKKIDGNRLKVNDAGSPEGNIGDENEVVCYRTLGRIMALCYPHDSFFKPGYMFPDNIFNTLASFSDPMEPAAEEWISAYLILKGISFDILKLCGDEVDLSSISDDVLKHASMLHDEDSEWTPEETRDFFQKAENREALHVCILEHALRDSSLGPVVTMAKEMKIALGDNAWKELRAEPLLMERIQGVINCAVVQNALTWQQGNNVSLQNHEKTLEFMRDWIGRATPEQLRQFVRAVTGNSALSPTMKMKIYTYNLGGNIPVSHTCVPSMELSAEYEDQAMFDAKVSTFLEHALLGTGFAFA